MSSAIAILGGCYVGVTSVLLTWHLALEMSHPSRRPEEN